MNLFKKKQFTIVILFLLVTLYNSLLAQGITRKAPYLIYPGNNTEMQVLFQLDSTDTCLIEWGTDTFYSLGSTQTLEYGTDHQHTYTFTNLIPATKYYYRVIADVDSHTGSFRAAPHADTNDIKFLAYGDTRSYPANHDIVAEAIVSTFTNNEDFHSLIISVGDLVNNGDLEQDWDNQFFSPIYTNIQAMLANLPYQSCMGNHEESGVLFMKYFPYPFVNDLYWSFDYGPAHFVCLDQYVSYSPGSSQYNWLVNDLASTNKPWKFIYLHEPGWSAGGHGNNSSVQNYIQPLCKQYLVSIVFAGHNHYYARAEVDRVVHITTGGGGAPLYSPNPSYPNIITTTMAYHFCKIEIDSNNLYFEVQKPDGTIIDSFSIELTGRTDFDLIDHNVRGPGGGYRILPGEQGTIEIVLVCDTLYGPADNIGIKATTTSGAIGFINDSCSLGSANPGDTVTNSSDLITFVVDDTVLTS